MNNRLHYVIKVSPASSAALCSIRLLSAASSFRATRLFPLSPTPPNILSSGLSETSAAFGRPVTWAHTLCTTAPTWVVGEFANGSAALQREGVRSQGLTYPVFTCNSAPKTGQMTSTLKRNTPTIYVRNRLPIDVSISPFPCSIPMPSLLQLSGRSGAR